jgi:Sec-independent protein translocase protein TatA
MDGIFGVGVGEVLIVLIVMFVIGGPKNTAKWARQLGLMVRQVRQYWAQLMAEIETDLGPDGKEIMDAAREFGKGAKQMSAMSPQKRLLGETMNAARTAIDIEANTRDVDTKTRPSNGSAVKLNTTQSPDAAPSSDSASSKPASDDTKYSAWTPPDDND